MTLTKKEKIMILVLLIMVYAFAFVKVVILNSLPKVKAAQTRLDEVNAQKAALDAELLNIETYKAEIKAKTVVNERLGDYLMENADISDSIQFIESFAVLLNTELQSISLGQPQQISSESMPYYGFPVSFSAVFSYEELQEVIRFCEGGAKKVSVSNFSMTPTKDKANKFDVRLSLVFYSINRESADKLYEYSRSRFKEFKDREGAPIFVKDDEKLPDVVPTPKATQSTGSSISISSADFLVLHRGYLYGGYNFEAYSSFKSSERSRMTTKEKVDVYLTLKGSEYTLETVDSEGKKDTFKGSIPDRPLTFYLQSHLDPAITENQNLQVNVTIRNDSQQTIRVKVEQSGGRLKLMDRDGKEIDVKSEKEKVYFQ